MSLADDATLATTVRCRREELGWTQVDLADRARVSQATVSRIESADNAGHRNGQRGPNVVRVLKALSLYETSGAISRIPDASVQEAKPEGELPQGGRVRIRFGSQQREVPLAAAVTFGRGPDNTWVVDHPTVPYTWFEVRWCDDGWAWRSRQDEEPIVGPETLCEALGGNWKLFGCFNRRVSVPEAYVQLLDASPPRSFVVDVATNVPLAGRHADRVERLRPPEATHFVADGRSYRYYAADPPTATRLGPQEPRVTDGTTRFRFVRGSRAWRCEVLLPHPPGFEGPDPDGLLVAHLESNYVASVVPYVEARLRSTDISVAALDRGAALDRWRALVGDPNIPPARLYEYHGKFESALAKKGVAAADSLLSDDVLGTKRINVSRRQLRMPALGRGGALVGPPPPESATRGNAPPRREGRLKS